MTYNKQLYKKQSTNEENDNIYMVPYGAIQFTDKFKVTESMTYVNN
jgi:hypothetical protein